MTRIPFPSTYPRGPQTEVCNLCGRVVNHDEGSYVEVLGPLAGMFVCDYHGDLITEPSWIDLRGADDSLVEAAAAAVREQPFGMNPWWVDGSGNPITVGYVQREDGTMMLREDGDGSYFEHEEGS